MSDNVIKNKINRNGFVNCLRVPIKRINYQEVPMNLIDIKLSDNSVYF